MFKARSIFSIMIISIMAVACSSSLEKKNDSEEKHRTPNGEVNEKSENKEKGNSHSDKNKVPKAPVIEITSAPTNESDDVFIEGDHIGITIAFSCKAEEGTCTTECLLNHGTPEPCHGTYAKELKPGKHQILIRGKSIVEGKESEVTTQKVEIVRIAEPKLKIDAPPSGDYLGSFGEISAFCQAPENCRAECSLCTYDNICTVYEKCTNVPLAVDENDPVLIVKVAGCVTVDTEKYCKPAEEFYNYNVSNVDSTKDESEIAAVSLADHFMCLRSQNNGLWCWGDNSRGAIGAGIRKRTIRSATKIPGNWKAIDTGDLSVCGIKENGSLWCWGGANYGSLGNGAFGSSASDAYAPQQVGRDKDWKSVSVSRIGCGIKREGELYCWGDDTLKNNFKEDADWFQHTPSLVPNPVEGSVLWTHVAVHNTSILAATNTGDVYAFGDNTGRGILGLGTNNIDYKNKGVAKPTKLNFPRKSDVPIDDVKLTISERYACALFTLNTGETELYCWGYVAGPTPEESRSVKEPVLVTGNYIDVHADDSYILLLDKSGQTWFMGDHYSGGEYFFESFPHRTSEPTEVTDWNFTQKAKKIQSAHVSYGCKITSIDKLYCWGNSGYSGVLLGKPDGVKVQEYEVSWF